MSESLIRTKKIQWDWIAISLFLYAALYLLPLFIAGTVLSNRIGFVFSGLWVFGGISIVAVVAGFLSKGVTIWEPAIAGVVLGVVIFGVNLLDLAIKTKIFHTVIPIAIIAMFVFVLSFFGACYGEFLQKVVRKNTTMSI